MRTLVLACEVMREELLSVRPSHSVDYSFLSMGLHVSPDRLRARLASELEAARDRTRIVLGFGLCGNATAGLISPHAPLVIPRVHDCIPLLLGDIASGGAAVPSLERGTFYLSGGWMEGERTLFEEHRRSVAKFGEKKALRILSTMLDSYERLLFIRTAHPRSTALEREAALLSRLLGLSLDTVEGRPHYFERLVNGPWTEPSFLHVAPGLAVGADGFSHLTGHGVHHSV